MRTTLTLDDDVYESALTLSKISGTPLGKVVSSLLRKSLSAAQQESDPDFPTFPVPKDTPMIPGNRAAELLEEMD